MSNGERAWLDQKDASSKQNANDTQNFIQRLHQEYSTDYEKLVANIRTAVLNNTCFLTIPVKRNGSIQLL